MWFLSEIIKSFLTRGFCFYFIVLVTSSCFVYAYVESYIHKYWHGLNMCTYIYIFYFKHLTWYSWLDCTSDETAVVTAHLPEAAYSGNAFLIHHWLSTDFWQYVIYIKTDDRKICVYLIWCLNQFTNLINKMFYTLKNVYRSINWKDRIITHMSVSF